MDVAMLEQALDEAFDQALVYHGFTDYIRDYEVIVYLTADPSTRIAPVASKHTTVLRHAGLVAIVRYRNRVIHTRTPLGQALLFRAH